MADVDKEKEQLKIETKITNFWAIILGVFVAIQLIFVYQGVESGAYTWQQYFIEYGDSLGAVLASISLAFYLTQMYYSRHERITTLLEAEKDRKLQYEENQLNRRITLVKERLEFYSSLYDDFADIYDIRASNIEQIIIQKRKDVNESFQRHQVKERYPRYVDGIELKIFTDYFASVYRSFEYKTMNDSEKEAVLNNINSLVNHIIVRYRELSTEYRTH